MRRVLPLLIVAGLGISSAAAAQGVLVVSQNKCDLGMQGELRAFADSAWIPLAQELVNEGSLLAAGSAFHLWGDEWNVIYWYTATNISTFLEAWSELIARSRQRYPAAAANFQAWCSEHKDSFYTSGAMTTPRMR